MIYKIFPQKDTFITNARVLNVAKTSSNVGASETLQLFKLSGSMHPGDDASRILLKFDVSDIGSIVPMTGATHRLKMYDMQHSYTLPSSFDAEISLLTQDWDEGNGLDVDTFSDAGYANWDKTKSTTWWTTPGATITGSLLSYHFDTGHEDIDIDITVIVTEWISGSITNNGLMVRLSSTLENNDQDYYVKMFHSRHTHYTNKIPTIDVLWDDSVLNSGSVAAASSSLNPQGPYFVNVRNIKNEYSIDDVVKFRLYVRPWDFNPATVSSSSFDISGSIISEAYYKIYDERTKDTIVPFSTGSLKFSRLSYDSTGNYFWFRMNTLSSKNVYRLAFLFCVDGQRHVIDEGFKFKVV